MYTLRRISGDGIEMNHSLGDNYTFISKERNPEEFKKVFNNHFEFPYLEDERLKNPEMEKCYAFVSNGFYTQPLWINQKAFIMTCNGQTFDNLSYM